MLCDKCNQNEAAVYIEQIVNGEKRVLRLCPECAAKEQMPMSFNDIFQGFLYNMQPKSTEAAFENDRICPGCGMSYGGFKKTGKLGCSKCYDTFSAELRGIFKNIQPSNEHRGKFPKKSGKILLKKRELTNLKTELRQAIEKEAYEKAAEIRDRIRIIENSAGGEW